MTRFVYLARFFVVVPPMPLLMIGTFVVIAATAIVIIVLDPSRATGALTPILLLQMFACSSGFDVPARRGHYDLLFTRGENRYLVAVAHWIASGLPGVVSWATVVFVHDLMMRGQSSSSLFSIGSVAALVLVSTIPWATTVRLPRFSGAIGWMLIIATAALVVPSIVKRGMAEPLGGWMSWAQTALAVLVYPPLLVGGGPPGGDRLIMAPALVVAVVALMAGVWSVGHRDVPLEAAQ